MPKWDILKRLETHLIGLSSSIDSLTLETTNWREALFTGPNEFTAFCKGGFKGRFLQSFQKGAAHLEGIETEIGLFEKKLVAWKDPSLLKKIKNILKTKALAQDRELAKQKYEILKTTLTELKSSWKTLERFKSQNVN